MIRKDVDEAVKFFHISNIFKTRRVPKDSFDFGDDQTVGRCLKRQSYTHQSDPDNSFGIYLGEHKEGFVVAVKALIEPKFTGCEIFSDLDELKQEWRLD